MAAKERFWISAVIIGGSCFVFTVWWVFKPVPPLQISQNQEVSLGFALDPHLYLNIKAIDKTIGATETGIVLSVKASNTAAGNMVINLEELRFKIQELNGESGIPVKAKWMAMNGEQLENGRLPARQQAITKVYLGYPNLTEQSTIVIWKETKLFEWLPFVRNSLLNPRLEIKLNDVGLRAAK